jgi:hypothetical protein
MRLVAFCEARADFEVAADLVDRVLRDRGPDWVTDTLDAAPDAIRSWHGDGDGRAFFVLRDLTKYVDALNVRVPHGHFSGKPGAADAVMGRTALAIVRALVKQGAEVDAVLVIRDLDDQPARRTGLEEARDEAQHWAPFRIVVGCANPKREAWVLCGFEPETPDEHRHLADLRRELGFQPHTHAHQLDAKNEQAKRSAKRVLHILTGGDREREQRCWNEAPLDGLRDRGAGCGLGDYLDEIERHILPLLARAANI